MPKFKLNLVVGLIVSLFFLFLLPKDAYATRTINSVTLNGSSSVTVAPNATITVSLNVTTTGTGPDADWRGTSWNITSPTCVNTTDHNGAGTYTNSFSITAPSSPGTYNISFIVYSDNACSQLSSATFTLTNGIVVSGSTPTPISTPTPTPTSGPTPTPGPGSTATPSPTNGTTSESNTSTIYYPSVTLSSYPSGNITEINPSFSGTASVENGTLTLVEYSLDGGSSWDPANPDDGKFDSAQENFSFVLSSLIPGSYTVAVRAKSQAGVYTNPGSYANVSFSVVAAPPSVTLAAISPNPTKDTTPIITGKATSRFLTIQKVEISLDGGTSWTPVKYFRGSFSFTPQPLEDGNYDIIARAFDNKGNEGRSVVQTLVVDLFPPIIGGSTISLGPQVLTPDTNGSINVIQNADITFAISIKGGPIKVMVKTRDISYELSKRPGTEVWVGDIGFKNEGLQTITITAIDGADNLTTETLGDISVLKPGLIKDKKSGQVLPDSSVKLYYYDISSKNWVLWDGSTYGQQNPQTTGANGDFSYMAPGGKYYIEVGARGYYPAQSQIISLNSLSALNPNFPLRSKPKISFRMPFIGQITLTIPNIFPPDSISITLSQTLQNPPSGDVTLIGKAAPNLALPNLSGNNVNVSNFSGKKLIIVYISSWSTQSVEQASIIGNLVGSNELPSGSGVVVVFLQENPTAVEAFMNAGNYKFDALIDKYGITAKSYDVTFLPKSYFLDSRGVIKEIYTGLLGKDEILSKLSNIR